MAKGFLFSLSRLLLPSDSNGLHSHLTCDDMGVDLKPNTGLTTVTSLVQTLEFAAKQSIKLNHKSKVEYTV